ncbi:MAG: glycosyltransferase family 2 protein [Bacteroidia bacterium]|nr:glycosyltransferase family 2 protein [Bacteroidia bacterium]
MYNPHLGWEIEVVSCYKSLKTICSDRYLSRLILVDDGNRHDLTKGKQYILDKIEESAWFSYEKNMGKGFALREGIRHCTGELILYTDFDFPYSISTMRAMLDQLIDEEIDVVIGIRDDNYYDKIKGPRSWLSKLLKRMNSKYLELITNDTQCGLKVFNRRGAEIFLKTRINRYLVDVEFLKLLSGSSLRQGLHVVSLREGISLSKVTNLRLHRELFSYIKLLFQS